jgi:hypothetical protein
MDSTGVEEYLDQLRDYELFEQKPTAVFLNRRAAARYRALASIIPGHEKFSWK